MTEQPTPAPEKKSWFARHKILSAVLALVVIMIIGGALGGGDGGDTEPAASDSTSSSSDDTKDAPAATEDEPAEEEPEANAYDEQYGTFKPVKKSGNGDAVVPLPEGATAGIVVMTHNGGGNFAVTGIDSSNQPTADLLANTIGSHKGTAAYGISGMGEPAKLKITAGGAWTVAIRPISAAPVLKTPAKGQGDGVFLYDGDSADWAIQHTGQGNFAVIQYGDIMPNLMVNEIGAYKGTVPASEGPSVVTITAGGAWSIK